MKKCTVCYMVIKNSAPKPKRMWEEETKGKVYNQMCHECSAEVDKFLTAYKLKRREETKKIMWGELERSL